jgi:predicted permease
MRKLWRRIYFLANRRRLERELAEEMAAHLEMMPAERRAEFGRPSRLQEEAREAWSWQWLQHLGQDLSYGVRVLAHAPGFLLGAVTVLAIGVGVNLAEYQIFDAMIFHRLTIRDADSALAFARVTRQGLRPGFAHGAVEFYRNQSRSFAWLVAEDASFNVTVESDPDVRTNLVAANYFASLGVMPALGRLLDARDAQPDAPAAAVLGYAYWQARWGADAGVVGRVVRVNNQPVEIVGVVPFQFEGLWPRRTDVWLPVALRPSLMPGSGPLEQDYARASETFFGKLKPGVPRAAAEAELTSLTQELARRQPEAFNEADRIQASHVQPTLAESIARSPAIAVFIVMVLLVLVSACANLGNMLLARGLVRQREIGIRLAIGASRPRIVRQLMTENLLLALLGAVAGLGFGAVSARMLLIALDAPAEFRVPMRWPVGVASLGLTLVSAVFFGLPSALKTARGNERKIHLRQSLVGVQVAVSCLLLIGSAVLAHAGILAASAPIAFDYANMVVVAPQFGEKKLQVSLKRQKLDDLSARLSALPGVTGVTTAGVSPLSGRVREESLPGLPRIYRSSVEASYFGVMGLPLVLGRTFLPGEENTVIVSESAARAAWPGQSPVGKTWKLAGADRTVVGVAKDSGANLVIDQDSVEAYIPLESADLQRCVLILHTRNDPTRLVRTIATQAAAAQDTLSVVPMRTTRDNLLEAQRRTVTLIGSVGAVATTLAAAGMFALVAFAVAERRRELGIRMAIGAGGRHILAILLAQNAPPMAIGVAAGGVAAAAVSRLVRSMVVVRGQAELDPVGFVAGVACFLLVAALATLSPAMRALRIDPSKTLREE